MGNLFPLDAQTDAYASNKLDPTKCGNWIRVLPDGVTLEAQYDPAGDEWPPCVVQAVTPFQARTSPMAYFEIEVMECGFRNIVTIGLTPAGFSLNESQPGWFGGSVGWHGDDGAFFGGDDQGFPFGSRWSNGDIVGIGVHFASGQVFVAKNGEFVGAPIIIDPKCRNMLFATVGVENTGAKARVNFGTQPFRYNFEIPVLKWKLLWTEGETKPDHRLNVVEEQWDLPSVGVPPTLFATTGSSLYMGDGTKTTVIELSSDGKALRHEGPCRFGLFPPHSGDMAFSQNCMDMRGNLWSLNTYRTYGLHVSRRSTMARTGFEAVFQIPQAKQRAPFAAPDAPHDPRDHILYNNELSLLALHSDVSQNVRRLAEHIAVENDFPSGIFSLASKPDHIFLVTLKNNLLTINFETMQFTATPITGENLGTSCTFVPVTDRHVAIVGGLDKSKGRRTEMTLLNVVTGEISAPEVISDSVPRCLGAAPQSIYTSSPLLTGSDVRFCASVAEYVPTPFSLFRASRSYLRSFPSTLAILLNFLRSVAVK